MTSPPYQPQTLDEALGEEVASLDRDGLRRTLRPVRRLGGALIELDAVEVVDFASNDYLGLAADPRLSAAAREALITEAIGAAAARLVSGTHPLHMTLEAELARFKRTEAALVFSSGYTANAGAIPAIVGRRDVIYSDALNHASLIDACRLSRAEVYIFAHGNTDALAALLHRDRGTFRRQLVVVDSMFSMDGDLFPLDRLVEVARAEGAWTYVDDAHGSGALGAMGRGAVEHWGVEGEIDVVMGTLGKSFGVAGAFIAGSRVLIDQLVHRARSWVFSTASPPALAAATLEALRIVRDEPARRDALRSNARRLRAGIRALGHESSGDETSHIVPLIIGDPEETLRVGTRLRERGFLVGAIRPPTVPLGTSRLRITASAAHTETQIDGLLEALADTLMLHAESRTVEAGHGD
jgi:8-amino-7-oxononanoate synthase